MSYRPITDIWMLARPKVKYYGAYPNGFLERARALLGITPYDSLLHVCGGKARDYPGKPRGFGPHDKTLDIDPQLQPDLCQDACAPIAPEWPAILIDRPYTTEDAACYAIGALPPLNPLLKNALHAVRLGGRVGVLDYLLPRPPKDTAKFVACVGVIVGYNNRMRCFSVFERT